MHAVWTLEPRGLGFAVTGSKHFLYIITKSCTCSTGRIHQQLLNLHAFLFLFFPFFSSVEVRLVCRNRTTINPSQTDVNGALDARPERS